jgi:excisionase family DNA binding protein
MMLTVHDAASRMGMSDAYVRRLIASGRLPCYRIGRSVRLDAADVDAYLATCRNESAVEEPTRHGPASHAPSWGELDARLAALKPTK